MDILHKSDPWQGEDCGQEKCLLCSTKTILGKTNSQDCRKRCIVYESWCISCEMGEREKIEEMEADEKEKREMIKNIKKCKYIGESSRSIYERGLEHQRDYEEMRSDSHMLKHYLAAHKEEEMEKMTFGMRIVKECRTAFNRQIAESVEIQNNSEHHLLNSKSEYNRCALPRLTAKMGEESTKEILRKKRE